MSTKIESLFSSNGIIDKKHKINTVNKVINQSILDEIENNGITIERLRELCKNGFEFFTYQTQITIHGLFPKVHNNYLNGYKNLFQNKNLSIGVKWNGIDADKKKRIYSFCKLAGFGVEHNSSKWNAFKQTRVKDREEAVEIAKEYKIISDRINPKLFHGGTNIYFAKSMFGTFCVIDICINGILEKNVNTIIEQITGLTMIELQYIKDKKEAERLETEKRWEREAKERKDLQEKQRAEFDTKKAEFIKNNPLTNFTAVENHKIDKGQIYAIVTKELQWKYFLTSKIGANYFRAECSPGGVKTGQNKMFKYQSHITAYLKNKEIDVKPKIETANKKSELINNIFIVDYSSKAIAIFGDTKSIKEQLKSLGCRFNAYLTYDNKKQAGWIAPISKREMIANII